MRIEEFLDIMDGYYNKNIRIICKDGGVFTGSLFGYTSAMDNEPDGESIDIKDGYDLIEIFTDEIKSIEILPVQRARIR